MKALRFRWETDDICHVDLGGEHLITVDHDNHGWDGMHAAIEGLTRLATALRIPVEIEGQPGI